MSLIKRRAHKVQIYYALLSCDLFLKYVKSIIWKTNGTVLHKEKDIACQNCLFIQKVYNFFKQRVKNMQNTLFYI